MKQDLCELLSATHVSASPRRACILTLGTVNSHDFTMCVRTWAYRALDEVLSYMVYLAESSDGLDRTWISPEVPVGSALAEGLGLKFPCLMTTLERS